MRILFTMRRQVAVYWPPASVNDEGKKVYGDPVELLVRWEDVNEQFLDNKGALQTSKAKVYTGDDLQLMGVLWLSSQMKGFTPGAAIDELTNATDPFKNPNAYSVRRFDKDPVLKVRSKKDFLRTAYL